MMENSDLRNRKCVACGNMFNGQFCNKCGQKVLPRFTGRYIGQRLLEDILGLESGLGHTFKELWLRPGKMIRSYIGGSTNQYYGPLKYLILWTALYLLLIPLAIGHDLQGERYFVSGDYQFFFGSFLNDFAMFLALFMQRSTNYYVLGIVPFLSLTCWLAFRSKGFNLTEVIIFLTYFYGQFAFCVVVISIVNLIPGWIELGWSTPIIMILYFVLFVRMQSQFFDEKWALSVLKALVILFLGTAAYWSVLILVFAIVASDVSFYFPAG
ncbi:hypothetical protein BH09BAC3_BH09BAC3_36970 [soil metagenome]